jgi:hypothetical protein
MEEQGLVSPNGLWPVRYQSLKVVAPAVYSRTGWIHQALDPVELGAAWDLPVGTLKALEGMDQTCLKSLEAVTAVGRTAPCQSLWAFGQTMCLFGLQAKDAEYLSGFDDSEDNKADQVSSWIWPVCGWILWPRNKPRLGGDQNRLLNVG